MGENNQMRQQRTKPKVATLMVLLLAGIAALGHIGATMAFTGPSTPIKTSLQPELNRYFLGPLDQGWSLFAPGPYSQDEYFTFRACLSSMDVCAGGQSKGAEFTEWRNVTAEEMAKRAGNMFADRETKQSKVIHGRLWGATSDLSSDARSEIAKPFIQGTPVFGVDLSSPEAMDKYSSSELSNLRAYKRLEDTAVGFASLYAIEQWGGAAIVEIKLRREPVTSFAQRHNLDAESTPIETNIGWRDTKEFSEAAVAAWK
ncbi:DUF5819 family protein [Glutamicibacter sp. AOP33-2CA-4]|uniref:DUF5819 family protein n=1 Tax=Glutamicibacter sp. AOP33-2CA-4 TaxID=3457690 RepID=UPI0040333A91